jgi:hypothetical protein
MPRNRSHTHQQLRRSSDFLKTVSDGPFSLREQATLTRLSLHVKQLHAIIPMLDVLNDLGMLWQSSQTITESNVPWRAAIRHLLSLYDIPLAETSNQYKRLSAQIQHGQQLITNFLQQDNIDTSTLTGDTVIYARKYLDIVVDCLLLRDDLFNLAETQTVLQQTSPFSTAWNMVVAIAEKYSVVPPINEQGARQCPIVPLHGDDSLTHCYHKKMIIADTVSEVKRHLREMQDKALNEGVIPLEMNLTGQQEMRPLVMYRDDKPILDIRLPTLFREFEFSVIVPQINQMRFLGQAKKEGGRTRLLSASSRAQRKLQESGITAENIPMTCSHCGNGREKHTTYLVESGVGIREIGQTCLDAFVGKPATKKVALTFAHIDFIQRPDFWRSTEMRYASAQRKPSYYLVEDFLHLAINLTQRHGFIKSDNPNSTRDTIIHLINHPDETELLPITEIKKKMASEIVTFYQHVNSNSNYIKSLQGVLESTFLKLDNRLATGILASAPASYFKHTGKGGVINEPFGQIKARGPLKLHVYNVEEFPEQEYPVVKYKMRDDQGRRFTWKATWPGNEFLTSGCTVLLNGTIKKHFEWEGQHFTHLNRCGDIQVVEHHSPAPDFNAGASKRVFKETFDFTILPYKEGGRIDGKGHLHITRSWRENNVVHEYQGTEPLPLNNNSSSAIITHLALQVGVQRTLDGGVINLKNKKDRKFLKALRDLTGFYEKALCPMTRFFWVDDAFAPWFTPYPNKYGATQATPDERSRRKPQIFTQISDAQQHGRRLVAGRLFTLSLNTPSITLAPIGLRLQDEVAQNNFRRRAIDAGHNLLMLCDEEGKVKRIEPLGWHTLTPGKDFTIESINPIHKPQNQALEQQSRRFLSGHQFITLSGMDTQPAIMQAVKQHVRHPDTVQASMQTDITFDTMSALKPELGGSTYAASLHFLSQENNRRLSKRNWLLLVTDSVTVYYLTLLGADVIDVRLRIGRKQHQEISPPHAIVLEHFRFTPAKVIQDVMTSVLDEVNDPGRGLKHRRV